jgi:DNA-directed RNA polymerase specialized sigma24 family protein
MSTEKWTDQEIISTIQGSYKENQRALRYLNNVSGWRPKLITWVIKQGGTHEEAEDVYSQTLSEFDRKIRFNEYRGENNLLSFFNGIGNNKWRKVLDKRNKFEVSLDMDKHDVSIPNQIDYDMIEEDQKRMLENISAEIGVDCKQALLLLYFDTPYEEIVTYFGLLNVEMAYKKVSRCRKRVHELIDEFPFLKHFFQN